MGRVAHGCYIGGRETPEHSIWREILRRCGKHKYYENITVCDAWKSYENFIDDVGLRPREDLQLDRIDNNKGYEPGNVRWTTHSVNQKNKRTTRFYTNGKFRGTPVEVADYLGISKQLARWRFRTWGTFVKGEVWQ